MSDTQIVRINSESVDSIATKTCLALGNFDGVHIGHQKLIQEAKNISVKKQVPCAMMTFYPHPRSVVMDNKDYQKLITPWETKKEILNSLGVEIIYLVGFNMDFARITPTEFVTNYIRRVQAIDVVVGEDFKYGKAGQGTAATLLEDGAKHGFDVLTVPSVMYGDVKVSSSLIRQLLLAGNMKETKHLLNRDLQIRGHIIDGEKRGRTLGFPTANISLSDDYLLPKYGVYSVKVIYNDKAFLGVLNIGCKPTFHKNKQESSVEVHILDFDEDIYGKHVSIEFMEYIREERRFDSKEQLIEQINTDIQQARNIYKKL
ncbi:bifunctional riboflavin kinase/FAD synthetase [Desulfuribacillus alkaliarsenatis]|uniref:Riboflavin biosynthesis protein n=1 Tax=Desulfuribacillus alkaliarsenatis TaxID=766136 RepID=A0A1E5G644_9FIRM|nr:bifunctional riboflavin kinase/FAD synthetase [Desulfuribacillus alkaliarsenatis]OEF98650.1 riboflavin biosynthesis protein RibF [Desulfuribacillus alkaliarsenatis]